jgi:hypothetical protein
MEPHQPSEHCKEIFSLLSQYLDLELPSDACQEIETHLHDCAPCIEFAASLRKTVELCRRYQPDEPPQPIGDEARSQLLDAYRNMLAARQNKA